ncbi:hypothetical protein [Arthrobacter pigmenti]
MSTNYGRGDGPEDKDGTTASSGNGNPTEPIADSHPTEPIGGTNPTEPIRGANATEPIAGTEAKPRTPSGATAAARRDENPKEWDNSASTTHGASAVATDGWDNMAGNPTKPAEAKRRPRVGTVVWGLIVIALAVVLLLAEMATLSLNMGQVIIGLLIGAGLALVIGGVISASNREKDDKRP